MSPILQSYSVHAIVGKTIRHNKKGSKFRWSNTETSYTTLISRGLPLWLSRKLIHLQYGDLGLIPGLGRFPGEGKGYPLPYSGLGNSMDRGAWQATVRGVEKSQTRLRDFHFSILTWAFWKQFLCNAWGVDFSCNLINSHVNAKFCWGRRNYI